MNVVMPGDRFPVTQVPMFTLIELMRWSAPGLPSPRAAPEARVASPARATPEARVASPARATPEARGGVPDAELAADRFSAGGGGSVQRRWRKN